LLKQYSKDPLVRGSYFSLLEIYRKTRKKKLKDFRKNIIDELDNLKENNPSKYWTLLNDLSRDNKTTSSDIANITWFNYFQELNNNKLNAPNSDIKKDLKRLEEEQIFSELDFRITDKEIIEGIFSLKNKKSSGMDMYKTIEFE
jgi:hypothetical protein